MTAASYPGLLAGLPAACDADYAPRRAAPMPVLGCSYCGRDDQHLTETPAGDLLCDEHRDAAAYDHEGDRR